MVQITLIKIKKWITKCFNEDNTIPFCWYNTENYNFKNEDLEEVTEEIKDYMNRKGFIREIIIVPGIELTRPQRTWGDMPEWFRPAGPCHSFDDMQHRNTFIFAIYNSEWGKEIKEEEIAEAVKSFSNYTVYRFKKEK